MMRERVLGRLEDILHAIGAIETYVAGKSFADYQAERLVRDAVERNIERISEATRHLPDDMKAKHPNIPWSQIAAIGNVLRHAYQVVDDRTIWDTVKRDVPPFKAAVEALLIALEAKNSGGCIDPQE